MTNYTELKRLAEAATAGPWKVKDRKVVTTEDASICCSPVFRIGAYKQSMANTEYFAAASPDVTLQMIDALDVQAGSIEAVQAANQRLAAERDKLRTQNQVLVKEMRHIAGISNGQVKRVADQALAAQAEGWV